MRSVAFNDFMDADKVAAEIGTMFQGWKDSRRSWEQDIMETRNYIFATSTRQTENAKLPWRNSTTLPKLTQIRDNLHANYIDALFPNDDWLDWVAGDEDSSTLEKRKLISAYMKNRTNASGFEETMDQLILDYIDYGNAFAGVTYVNETITGADGKTKLGYRGPKAYRISPYDIVFDMSADSFRASNKIIRTVKPIGDLMVELRHYPDQAHAQQILDLIKDKRVSFNRMSAADRRKVTGFRLDGFTDIEHYFGSNLVEVLEFYGTIYDMENNLLYEDYVITVVDRTHVIRAVPRNASTNIGNMFHVGWRKRPDNLYAQGPLDKLVGMQYRIDHLENLKADVFDQIAFPQKKIRGEVHDFSDTPGERIYIGDEGDVTYLNPPVEALQADNQIAILEAKMEEYAGAPKEAMGIRTPGEKTAYEVQQLQNAASRIFQAKINQFERMFLEPIVNAMLEQARERAVESTTVGIMDEELGIMEFLNIRPSDIAGSGKLYPRGARHYAAIAKSVQELNAFFNSALGNDPTVRVHFSGKQLAKLSVELLKLEKYSLYQPNIMIAEQMETQQLQQAAQAKTADQSAMAGKDIEEIAMLQAQGGNNAPSPQGQ